MLKFINRNIKFIYIIHNHMLKSYIEHILHFIKIYRQQSDEHSSVVSECRICPYRCIYSPSGILERAPY